MRTLAGLLIGICWLTSNGSAWASCRWAVGAATPDAFHTVAVPQKITIKPAPIGGVLASFTGASAIVGTVHCDKGEQLKANLNIKGLEPSGIQNVYKTGVEGVGIRIHGMINNSVWWTPPQTTIIQDKMFGYQPNPAYIKVEYVRTGVAVGSGRVSSDFTVEHIVPGVPESPITYEPNAKFTELVNDIYFTSCESQTPTLNVPMGKQYIKKISTNTTPKNEFSFEVRCRGLKPSKPAPVKIYFEGDSPADGQLNLSRAGQPGVARGVQIALTTGEGAKLPFNQANAINLKWLRSEPTAEVYRFSGVAQYVPNNSDPLKPGRGDATMTYVLDYN